MGSLNSVVIVHRDGAVIAASPASLQLKSMRSDWGRRLLDTRIPEISKPFRAPTGRLLIFLSHPVIDGQGHLLGYVGGTIYLNEKNLLHTIFVHHYYRDGSYIYVVDRDGTVIYHPNSGYVGDMSRANPAVAEVMTGVPRRSASRACMASTCLPATRRGRAASAVFGRHAGRRSLQADQ
ncbi:hypothetical protein ACEQUB_01215 [Ralstonia syzygii]